MDPEPDSMEVPRPGDRLTEWRTSSGKAASIQPIPNMANGTGARQRWIATTAIGSDSGGKRVAKGLRSDED
jgi:hypothetical protein